MFPNAPCAFLTGLQFCYNGIYYIWCILSMLDAASLFFLLLIMGLVELPGHGPAALSTSLCPSPVLCSSVLCLVGSPQAPALAPGLCFSALHYYAKVINISSHTDRSCMLLLSIKAMVMPCEGKQSKLGVATQSLEKLLLQKQIKPIKGKLQAGLGKVRQSKPEKTHS